MNITTKMLETLLKEAAAAHHKHESERGEKDDNWATWYARYLMNRISGK